MSTEQNKAIIRRAWDEVVNQGKLAAVDEFFAANYVYHGPGGQEVNGVEGLRQLVTTYRTAFPDLHVTIEDLLAEGNKVVSRFTLRGTQKGALQGIAPTGKPVTITGVDISRIEDSKIVEDWEELDMLNMWQQLGVVPPPGPGGG